MTPKSMLICAAGIVAAGALAVVVTEAQQSGTRRLTPEDYIEIQQLIARYPYALDGALEEGKAWADLFTDDAVFEHIGRTRLVGRNELTAVANRPGATALTVQHFVVNHTIAATAEGAVGSQYLLRVSPYGEMKDGVAPMLLQTYHYRDVYVKTPKGWRIKSRTVQRDPENLNNDTTPRRSAARR